VEGNKRAAFLSMGLFLGINRYRLIVKPVDTIQAVLALASGYMSEDELAFWIRNNMQKIS
jgi:death-on-curing protein